MDKTITITIKSSVYVVSSLIQLAMCTNLQTLIEIEMF